jgi:hypothetical protein
MPEMFKIRNMPNFAIFMYYGDRYVKINSNFCVGLYNGLGIYPTFNNDDFEVIGYMKETIY